MPEDTSVKPDEDVNRIRMRIRESSLARYPHILQAERNDAMFMGRILPEDEPLSGHSYFLINKTGPAVIAHAQVQMESKPRIDIQPRESAAPPRYFIGRKALMTVKSLIDRGFIDGMAEEPAPTQEDELGILEEAPTPVESQGFRFEMLTLMPSRMSFEVNESQIEQIMPLMGNWPAKDGRMMPPALRPKDLTAVDDATTAKALRNMQNIDWDRDDNDAWLMEDVIDCNKFGWSCSVGTWDPDKFLFCVMSTDIRNVFFPINCTNVQKADYIIVREFISADRAKMKYPQAVGIIDEYEQSHPGGGTPVDSFGQDEVPYLNNQFERQMIYVYHEWSRNVRYPMAPDEAIDTGRVVLKDGVFLLTDEEYEVTDEQTDPASGNWPTKPGIRYVQLIGDKTILDVECPYRDIPLMLNKNIPITGRPYGQGEPERLWFIQKFIDKLASILIDHLTYYRSPQQIYPFSVYKKLYGRDQIHSYPGRDMFLEDGTFERFREFFSSGKGFTVDPPTITTGYVDLWITAMQIHDELSGNVQVLQGRSPGSDTSGKALETLQTAARGMIGFKAFQTENMLKQLARLRLDAHRKFLPLFMWEKMNDAVPREALAAMRDRALDMEFDVRVTVASGGGELLRAKKEEVRLDVGAGLASPEYGRKVLEYEDEDKTWQNPAMAQAPTPAPKQPPGGAAA